MVVQKDMIQAVVDIGSSQLRVCVAKLHGSGTLEVIGCGVVPSPAVKNGMVTDIAQTAQALYSAIEEAERQSNVEIRNVDAAIGGQTVTALNTTSQTLIRGGSIHQDDIDRVVIAARDKGHHDGMQLIHALEQQFVLDQSSLVDEPFGMRADYLDAHLHVLSVRKNIAHNVRRSIEATGLGVNALVFSGLASSYAVSTIEERELGVCVIDIGAGTTNFMMWQQHSPIYSGGIDLGGDFVSSAIAQTFATTRQYAEMLKCQFGVMNSAMLKTQHIEIPSTGYRAARSINSSELIQCLIASYQQIFTAFSQSLYDQGLRKNVGCSVILTGGAAQIPGLASYATEIFNLPVRVVKPQHIDGMPEHLQNSPGMITTLGMLQLLQDPIEDHIWAKAAKTSIISRLSNFLNRS